MNKKIYITTPIYYASGDPHIGHAYTTILADVICRYKKMLGHDVFFLTGMDEHGQKILEKANTLNKDPQQFVDGIADKFKELWKNLDIDYSGFLKTTSLNHCNTVKKVFSKLLNEKLIYLGNWEGLYCVQCEENYTKSQATLNDEEHKMYCKVGHELSYKKEESFFLKISLFQDWLKNYLLTHSDFIFPQTRVKELMNNFINQGISDLSISRTSYDWGIHVDENRKHVVYVWIDALLSYLTGLNYLEKNDALFQKFWNDDSTEVIHLMSKEITRFHCIYWPIILKILNLRIPSKIISHGWIITDKGKMSKSLGNVIDPNEYIKKYGSDSLRYFLSKEIDLNNDGIFSEEIFINTFNSDLANNYGNLVSRCLGMLKKYSNQKIIKSEIKNFDEFDNKTLNAISYTIDNFKKFINLNEIKNALNLIMSLGDIANKYIEDKKPWVLFKENKSDKINAFLFVTSNVVRIMTVLLSPVLIKGTKSTIKQFNFSQIQLSLEKLTDFDLLNNHVVGESTPIYLRIPSKI